MSGTFTSAGGLTAQQFLGTIGVDTHIAYTDGGYADVQNIISDLKNAGVTQIRDGISNGQNGSAPISSYIQIAQAGIRFTFVIEPFSSADLAAQLALVDQVQAAVPGSVVAIEGPNEINNQPLTYNGVGGLQGALNAQAAIYAAVHSDSRLSGVPVYYFTGYGAGGIAEGPDPTTTPGLADFDNQHPYPVNGQAPAYYVSRPVALGNVSSPTAPAVFTETGYTTNQVNADVQAKYELDLLMDAAREGVSKTFLYELMDAYAPGSPQGDAGYGLYDYTKAPKEIAGALSNLTTLLQDPGANASSFVPSVFTYSLSGLPSTGYSLALQKSDGTNIVSVWNEPQIWNNASRTEIAAPVAQVTVGLGATYASVLVFDPLSGTVPIATYASVSSVTIGVTDHPLFVEFGGTAAPPPSGGPDTLVLNVGEIAKSGKDAAFTVSVDGTQIGGVRTVTASQLAGATQNIVVTGSFGAGPHTVSVAYLTGFTGNAADYGRTLYLNAITFDNATTFPNGQFAYNTTANYTVKAPSPAVPSNAGTADTLVLNLSETAVSGQDAQFLVSLDGQIIGGGLQTVTASHAAGASQNITLTGSFGAGTHAVTVNFINGFAGAAADQGRMLYVNAATLDGAVTTLNASQAYDGSQTYQVSAGAAPPPVMPPGGPSVTLASQTLASDTGASAKDGITSNGAVTLTGAVSGAAGSTVAIYNGAAAIGAAAVSNGTWTYAATLAAGTYSLYAVATDPSGATAKTGPGQTITVETAAPAVAISTPSQTVTASGATAALTLTGTVNGAPGVGVQIKDGAATLGAATVSGGAWTYATSLATGSHSLSAVATDLAGNTAATAGDVITVAAAPPPQGGPDTLVLNVGEIAKSGKDAAFTVSVDGAQIGGVRTVTASQLAGATQNVVINGSFGAGPHTVSVAYLTGFTGNAADYGRTLYLNAITFDNATTFPNGQFAYNTTANYTVKAPSPAVPSNSGTADTLVLNLSETAVSGQDAQFLVSLDGQIIGGGLQTVTASHAAGASQNITLTGSFGGAGTHAVTVNFINGFAGAAADQGRMLYVNAATLDGAVTTLNASQAYDGSQTYQVSAGTAPPPVMPPGGPSVTLASQTLASDTGASATDGITSNGAVTLTGAVSGAAGSTVAIYNGAAAIGAAAVSNGTWTYAATLAAGTYSLYAVATDPSGATAKTGPGQTIMVETAAPSVAISTPSQTVTASGATAALTLTGTVNGAPGVGVQIKDGAATLGAATVSGGAWTYAASLATGSHSLTAVATDLAGNTAATAGDVITVAAAPPPQGGPDTLVLNVGEIAKSGKDAAFTVSVDGAQIGGVRTVTASQLAGATQNVVINGSFGAGPHTVSVAYLTGFTGNAADYGRTLYLNAITFDNATTFPNGQFAYNTTANYTVKAPSPAVPSNSGTADTLVLNLSETAVSGQDAQFLVSLDGQIIGGGLQTVTASHAAGASQNITLTGSFGGAGTHAVTVNFINGFAGAAADQGRMLYVNAATLDGAVTTLNASQAYVGSQTYQVSAGAMAKAAAQTGAAGQMRFTAAAGGGDAYSFRQGDGLLRIDNASPASGGGELDFGAGLTENTLWFSRSGDDLRIDVLNSHDQVLISGWFGADASARLSEFVAGDGLKLDGGLSGLLSAMQGYQSAHPGFVPGAATVMPPDGALADAILKAWHH